MQTQSGTIRSDLPDAESHRVIKRSSQNTKKSKVIVDRSYRKAKVSLITLQEKLGVDDSVMERATDIYHQAISKKMIHGRSIAALAAASFYVACRSTGTQLTLKDIQQACNISRKDISRCYRLMLRELDIRMPVVDAATCVDRIANDANLSDIIRLDAIKILQMSSISKISAGKDPMGLAAAALYLVCNKNGEKKTQKSIAIAADMTEVTIRNRYKGLQDVLGI